MPFKSARSGLSLGLAGLSGIGRFDPSRWSPVAIRDARAHKRRSTYICRIDVMGVAAVFFVLLALCMVTIPPFHHLSVDLFDAKTANLIPAALREDAMNVVVERDGTIYFDNKRVRPNDLPQKIHEWVDSGSERRVYISADARSRYSDVKIVLEQLQAAGIEHVTFLASPVDR